MKKPPAKKKPEKKLPSLADTCRKLKKQLAVPLGWKCPECQVVHAPDVKECRCKCSKSVTDHDAVIQKRIADEKLRVAYEEQLRKTRDAQKEREREDQARRAPFRPYYPYPPQWPQPMPFPYPDYTKPYC